MRISDWSSDVCSSDLGVGFVKGCSDAWYTNALPGTAQGGEPVYDRSSGIAASAMSAHAIGNRPQTPLRTIQQPILVNWSHKADMGSASRMNFKGGEWGPKILAFPCAKRIHASRLSRSEIAAS